MKVIIIEDEQPAAAKLLAALRETGIDYQCLAQLATVKDSVRWFRENPPPELVFMDIELSDGQSFGIFNEVSIGCPVIFTTAYHEYWQEAFEHNSIDYLLKPVKAEKLRTALNKYETLRLHFAGKMEQLKHWQQNPPEYKKRYLIKRGSDYISLRTDDIAYCYAAHKLVCLVDGTAQKYLLDKSLSDLEKELDPARFFRLNRKYMVNINAISRLRSVGKGKLQVDLNPPPAEEVLVSSELTLRFKDWMNA